MAALLLRLSAALAGLDAPAAIVAGPADGLLGEPIRIEVTGLPPGTRATLRVTARGREGREWRSSATFVAGPSGRIRATDMTPADERPWPGRQLLVDGAVESEIAAETSAGALGPARVRRALSLPAAAPVKEPLKQEGVEGLLIHPKGATPLSTVVVLSGSEGGLATAHADYLASHGFAALALGYHDHGALPA